MSGSRFRATAGQIDALVAAHRAAQTDHRSALATEDRRALLAADRRAAAAMTALLQLGAVAIAEGLVAESRSGDALLVALTCDELTHNEVDLAMASYRTQRERVTADLAAS